ncbi:MAG: hydroxymethylglutaryl-CoA reductase [Candidatus Thorarchaeota archaeon]
MQIPAFLLRKLYVKGSLENVEDGFVFKLKNPLSPGTAVSMEPLKVGETEYSLDALTIKTEGDEVKASGISESNPVPIKVGVEMLLHVAGEPLPEGEHKIFISLKTKEAGVLAFDFTDAI